MRRCEGVVSIASSSGFTVTNHDKKRFSLTDIAKIKNSQAPADTIKNCMRNKKYY